MCGGRGEVIPPLRPVREVCASAAGAASGGRSNESKKFFTRARTDVSRLSIHLQRGDEGFLRDVDLAELPHALLALLLLVEQLALARGVAAVAFRRHVLAQG